MRRKTWNVQFPSTIRKLFCRGGVLSRFVFLVLQCPLLSIVSLDSDRASRLVQADRQRRIKVCLHLQNLLSIWRMLLYYFVWMVSAKLRDASADALGERMWHRTWVKVCDILELLYTGSSCCVKLFLGSIYLDESAVFYLLRGWICIYSSQLF